MARARETAAQRLSRLDEARGRRLILEQVARDRQTGETRAKARGFRSAAEMERVQRSAEYRAFITKSWQDMGKKSSAQLSDAERKKITRMWRLRKKHKHSTLESHRKIVGEWLEMLGYDISKNRGKEEFDY